MNAPEKPVFDPSASADGKRNAFHLRCNVVGHCRPYAACLNLCSERKSGRLESVYAECSAAIGKKICPALAMRREEKDANRAIYFIERIRSMGESFFEKARDLLGASAATPAPVKSKPSRKSSVIDKIDTTGFSEVIRTDTVATKEVAAPAVKPGITPMPGESLIEMARRMMGKS